MNGPRLRMAAPTDVAALLDIYAWYVEHTAVTFEITVPSRAEFAERITDVLAEYPYLVAEVDGKTAGYAYSFRHKERAAYQWNAEFSVYLHPDYRTRGLGTILYSALLEIAQLQKLHNIYGGITLPNPASEKLHVNTGFSLWGIMRQTGYKLGSWHDVAWYCKRIAGTDAEPAPPVRVSDLPREAIDKVLHAHI